MLISDGRSCGTGRQGPAIEQVEVLRAGEDSSIPYNSSLTVQSPSPLPRGPWAHSREKVAAALELKIMDMPLRQHMDLLNVWSRGLALRELIRETVQPGMRVLDAGSGTGLLSLWAAQAGGQVTAVDHVDYPAARLLARENGVEERIRFLQSDLARIDAENLGGRVDVLLAMVYYNDARRDEGQSRLVRDLVLRCLAPGGRVIPDRVEYRLEVCSWPEQDLSRHLADRRAKRAEFEARYELSFGSLFETERGEVDLSWFPKRGADGNLPRPADSALTEAVSFEIDYRAPVTYPDSLELSVVASGKATTAIWRQSLLAGQRLVFSNESVSWLSPAEIVAVGDSLKLPLDSTWRDSNVFSLAVSTDADSS